jgi:hypothetical protein
MVFGLTCDFWAENVKENKQAQKQRHYQSLRSEARWMGRPLCFGWWEKGNSRSPPGMTTRKATTRATGSGGGRLHHTHRRVVMDGAPVLFWLVGERQQQIPSGDDNQKGNDKGHGSVAGGTVTSHPSQSCDGWGAHFVLAGARKDNSRSPSGMTTRKATAVATTRATDG